MKNNDDIIRTMLEHAKPDQAMAMEAIKKANATIQMLTEQVKVGEARWMEMFVVCGTILNKLGREIHLTMDDLIPLSPLNYKITVETVPNYTDEGGVAEGKVVRLRPRFEEGEKEGTDDAQ